MIKKIGYSILVLFIALLGYSFYLSPRLGGLLPAEKEHIDKGIHQISFDSISSPTYKISYTDKSGDSALKLLRKDFKLDSIVSGAASDFEKITKIQSWVQSRWKHHSTNTPAQNDAYYILTQAAKGARFRCVEYSMVAGQCLQALGFKVRGLGLMTKDISEVASGAGHVVNEVYLEDRKKWAYIDPQWDVMVSLAGVPLNAIELQQAIALGKDFTLINPNEVISKAEYIDWISPYLYYFTTSLNQGAVSMKDRFFGIKKQLTLVPLEAKEPKTFQGIFRINTTNFTHKLTDFYPEL